jgi:hypothetical protein
MVIAMPSATSYSTEIRNIKRVLKVANSPAGLATLVSELLD